MTKNWRDPSPEELETPEFNAVWDCIKEWDIGIPQDITEEGHQLYSGATGNHVVAILDSLREMFKKEFISNAYYCPMCDSFNCICHGC